MKKRLVVIGGGAAGFFCAVNVAALNADLEVIVLEKTSKLLSKVRVSGGGRCNVTHACFGIAAMAKKYPRGNKFVKQTFRGFFTNDTIRWFEERGVKLKTEEDGRMFPDTDSSESVIRCLLTEANRHRVQIMMNKEVVQVEKSTSGEDNNHRFKLILKDRSSIESDYLCIAAGGYPKSIQYDWLRSLGHEIAAPVPSLFTFNLPKNPISELMGVSVPNARVRVAGTAFSEEGPLLITHWGLSGPAILKLSAFAALDLHRLNYDFSILVNWIPEENENSVLQKLKTVRHELAIKKVGSKSPFGLPQRLWLYHLQQCGISPDIQWANLPAKNQNALTRQLCSQPFSVKGKTTFKEEFVTAGGISPEQVNATTMESKIHKNLYFAGEILNVDGITGGYNFQNAWTTGWLAARAISK